MAGAQAGHPGSPVHTHPPAWPGLAGCLQASIEGQGVGKLRVAPVLLRKGGTHVALYGLGNLRDERLCRLFQTPGCVEW